MERYRMELDNLRMEKIAKPALLAYPSKRAKIH